MRYSSCSSKKGLATPLMFAACNCRIEMVRDLLDHGAEVNAINRNCNTALMSAAGCGNIKTVKLLLDHGADTSAMDRDGRTALAHAERRMNNDVAKLLQEMGAHGQARGKKAGDAPDKAELFAACEKQLWNTKTVTGQVLTSEPFKGLSIRPGHGNDRNSHSHSVGE